MSLVRLECEVLAARMGTCASCYLPIAAMLGVERSGMGMSIGVAQAHGFVSAVALRVGVRSAGARSTCAGVVAPLKPCPPPPPRTKHFIDYDIYVAEP